APLMRNRVVAVVGGGDSALQEALTLAQHVARVIVLHRGPRFTAQTAYIESVSGNPKIEVRFDTIVVEVFGDHVLTGVRTRAVSKASTSDVEVTGLFVYVGLAPATAWLNNLLDLDSSGAIRNDSEMRCRQAGLFAAGTVRAGAAGRAAAAAGEGATA